MKIAFAINNKNKDWIAKAISIFTRSAIYHCEFVFSDGSACIVDPTNGVHIGRRNYDYYSWLVIPLDEISLQEELFIQLTCKDLVEKGAKYDYIRAIFGGIFNINNPSKWFCSELCANLLAPKYNIKADIWYSPAMLWKDISEYLANHGKYQV